ncbi:MAG: 5-formyltetrahydrofolate cyclo-ligase [Acutalibacteraceae bacterium]
MPVRNIKEIKIQLRNTIKKQRASMPQKKRSELDTKIRNTLYSLRQYKKCEQLLVYVSKDIEVDTISIIKDALKQGKKVAVPKCITKGNLMDFYYINSIEEDLESGTFGVLEPVPDRCEKVTDFSNALCIVPGLSFDAQGFRLGYGKGYYDRFLNGFEGDTVGLCYSMCVRWELPHGYYDRPVDILVTDRYFRKIRKTSD